MKKKTTRSGARFQAKPDNIKMEIIRLKETLAYHRSICSDSEIIMGIEHEMEAARQARKVLRSIDLKYIALARTRRQAFGKQVHMVQGGAPGLGKKK